MEHSEYIILLTNFLLIGFLPYIFFKQDGKFTPMWAFTALPYILAPIVFTLQFFEIGEKYIFNSPAILIVPFHTIGIILCIISLGLIFMTMGTHRIPVALWHQDKKNDKPNHIVTWGSYKYVRHPFYASFIVAFAGCILLTNSLAIVGIAIYTILILNFTAKKEEKRLSSESGEIGDIYKQYLENTGRFFPKLIA